MIEEKRSPWLIGAATYLAFILVGAVAYTLYRTPLGLAVRAAGENPSAVAAQGLSVAAIRMGAVIFGSGLMALGVKPGRR